MDIDSYMGVVAPFAGNFAPRGWMTCSGQLLSITQYTALMATEGVTLAFTPEAVQRIAELATQVNDRTENIGARRLHTVMERLLDEVSFHAPDLGGQSITIDAAYVDRMLADIAKSDDLSRYIL